MATESLGSGHRHLWSGMVCEDADADVGVMGVPFDGAVCYRRGAASAPARLRELTPILARSTEEGRPLSLRLRDYGDVPLDLDWPRYYQTVEDCALQVLSHPLALFLGGDHSVTIPLMRAFERAVQAPFGILHVDAHLDLFEECDGHRWSHACTERRAVELAAVDPRHLVFVGVRSFCEEERSFLEEHPETACHTARECYRRGMEAVAADVVERLRDLQAVYVTLDIDGLDPAYAPGTGTPEGGGLSTRDLLELVRVVFRELPVRAMDVVEVAPPLDHADMTSFAALKVIYEALGAVQERGSAP